MPVHNKLVRDKILQIIEESGKDYSSIILDEKEYVLQLRKKLLEEIDEYLSAKNDNEAIEELADILEVVNCLAKIHKVNPEKLEHVRKDKEDKRGSFKEKVFLIEVHDE
ncbi:MAG: phosphoribosyl-ATP pyrophosphohydrolase [Bacillales bacterium]|jgi:predicted house-cleaning noncanonical NTP pyrophosphatase (MazG superfamily)|nr:phosphoribosyl-ATP pyrophosphohydrolase [Bacillales bacterium]